MLAIEAPKIVAENNEEDDGSSDSENKGKKEILLIPLQLRVRKMANYQLNSTNPLI